jgi:hypothetical protein
MSPVTALTNSGIAGYESAGACDATGMGYTAKPPGARSGWDRALPIVAVLVGIALGVLVGYFAFGGNDDDDGGGSTSSTAFATGTSPVKLPETIGDFRDTIAVQKERAGGGEPPPGLDARIKNAEEVARRTTDAYSEAYGGAGVGVRQYADSSLERQATVIAVRARTPGLVNGPVQDPAYL